LNRVFDERVHILKFIVSRYDRLQKFIFRNIFKKKLKFGLETRYFARQVRRNKRLKRRRWYRRRNRVTRHFRKMRRQ
jgi:hypothetical protein